MQLRATSDPNRFARALFTGLPNRYDMLAEVLSLGQNRRWRRAMVDQIVPARPRRLLDVATGTAGVALRLTEQTDTFVTGLDLTEAMLRRGQANVAASAADGRVELLAGRAEELPFPDAAFDAVTFTYLLRYVADPAATLRELTRVLKPESPMASLDFLVPRHSLWRWSWWLYTRLVLPVAGSVGGAGRDAGRGLLRPEHPPPLPAVPPA